MIIFTSHPFLSPARYPDPTELRRPSRPQHKFARLTFRAHGAISRHMHNISSQMPAKRAERIGESLPTGASHLQRDRLD
jgi:hypothetical protein